MENVLVLQAGEPEFDHQNSQWKRESLQKNVLQLHMHTIAHTHHGTCTPGYMHSHTHTCIMHTMIIAITFETIRQGAQLPQALTCVPVTIIKTGLYMSHHISFIKISL